MWCDIDNLLMFVCANGFQKQQISFKNNITVECTWWKGKWELERVGVAVGGRIGGVRPILLSFFLYGEAGGEGWQTFVLGTFSRIGSLYRMKGAGECAPCVCVCVWGLARAAVGGGSVKTPRFCSNSRFHNGVKWSQEMFAWPRHCTVTWGLLYSRASHTHTQWYGWASTSIFTIIVV